VKLINNQVGVTELAAQQLFNDPGIRASNASDAPKILAAAQQMASISRRLVTTDSYDLPAASGNMPSWATEAGPDGVMNTGDDFTTVTGGHPLAQATIVDLLHYRVFLTQRLKDIAANNWPLPLTNGRNATVRNETDIIFNGDANSVRLMFTFASKPRTQPLDPNM